MFLETKEKYTFNGKDVYVLQTFVELSINQRLYLQMIESKSIIIPIAILTPIPYKLNNSFLYLITTERKTLDYLISAESLIIEDEDKSQQYIESLIELYLKFKHSNFLENNINKIISTFFERQIKLNNV